jgi:sulfite dehydrogenase
MNVVTLGAASFLSACRTPDTHVATGEQLEGDWWYSGLDQRPLMRFPEKAPLILLTDRPPQLETPLRYFLEDFTPNEAHFVRWHFAGIPTTLNGAEWRLDVSGLVNRPLQLSLDDLRRRFDAVSLVAVNQCSGNSRGLFEPRVPGGQWRNGAMGNARWTGVRLKDVLDNAGVKAGAVEVAFRGLDQPPLSASPAFEKSLALEHARDGEVMLAYEMNGQPLPLLNGFPVRLIVPGWYGTYWVKSLSLITVLDTPLQNFWMKTAYRIPNNPDVNENPDRLAVDTIPINRFAVHSIFVSPEPGEAIAARKPREVQGLATDYGAGIRRVEFSSDGGRSWSDATLGADLGRYSWRRWRFIWNPPAPGVYRCMVRATNRDGVTQLQSQWNRSGFERRLIEHMDVRAT